MENENTKKCKGLAIASLVLGIIACLLSCIGIGIIPAIPGIIFGIIATVNKNDVGIAGIIFSGIALFIGGILLIDTIMQTYAMYSEKTPYFLLYNHIY